ncbi:MAG: hypothetical protein NUV84_02470 [Candidatus Uhrbacteria bacterium]|nr:hypothetical protein [Candidatus Uhrbacteria bacterium]
MSYINLLSQLAFKQLILGSAVLLWTLILGIGFFTFERRQERKKELGIEEEPGIHIAHRFLFFLVGIGYGWFGVSLYAGAIIMSALSDGATTSRNLGYIAIVSLVLFFIPGAISLVAMFKTRIKRVAYLCQSLSIVPAFIALLCFSLFRRIFFHASSLFPKNSTIILFTWGTWLALSMWMFGVGIIAISTVKEDAADMVAQEYETKQNIREQQEAIDRMTQATEELTLTYIEEWQLSPDHRRILVTIEPNGAGTAVVEKNGLETTRETFVVSQDHLRNLVEMLDYNTVSSLNETYCDSPGQCIRDPGTYTLQVSLFGEQKKVIWSSDDPEAEKITFFDRFSSLILRTVPISLY